MSIGFLVTAADGPGMVGILNDILRLCFACGSSALSSGDGGAPCCACGHDCDGARSFVVTRLMNPGRLWPSSPGEAGTGGRGGKSLPWVVIGADW
jgi:hypothetical protein